MTLRANNSRCCRCFCCCRCSAAIVCYCSTPEAGRLIGLHVYGVFTVISIIIISAAAAAESLGCSCSYRSGDVTQSSCLENPATWRSQPYCDVNYRRSPSYLGLHCSDQRTTRNRMPQTRCAVCRTI